MAEPRFIIQVSSSSFQIVSALFPFSGGEDRKREGGHQREEEGGRQTGKERGEWREHCYKWEPCSFVPNILIICPQALTGWADVVWALNQPGRYFRSRSRMPPNHHSLRKLCLCPDSQSRNSGPATTVLPPQSPLYVPAQVGRRVDRIWALGWGGKWF